MALLFRIFFCIFIFCLCLYSYIDRQNHLTFLRLEIPQLVKSVQKIKEENERLQYEIDRFESPIHLMEILKNPEFSHLKYPYLKDVILLPDANVSVLNIED